MKKELKELIAALDGATFSCGLKDIVGILHKLSSIEATQLAMRDIVIENICALTGKTEKELLDEYVEKYENYAFELLTEFINENLKNNNLKVQ